MAGLSDVVVLHFESCKNYRGDKCLAQCTCSQSGVEQGESRGVNDQFGTVERRKGHECGLCRTPDALSFIMCPPERSVCRRGQLSSPAGSGPGSIPAHQFSCPGPAPDW
eukprot:10436552-Alexandrium_andersonii.AAC.1